MGNFKFCLPQYRQMKRKEQDRLAISPALWPPSFTAMVDKKRATHPRAKSLKNQKKSSKKVGDSDMKRKRSGPRLPNSMRKELGRLNKTSSLHNSDDEDIDSNEGNDFYEYEEPLPQEESRKNRRYDPVDNYEYQLPDNFEDENVLSDDDDENDYDSSDRTESSKQLGDEVEDDDDERHMRMLQGITGMPSEVFEGKKKKKKNIVMSEAYPESEFNPSRDVLEGSGQITIEDLLEPLQGKAGYSKLRKRMHQMDKKSVAIQAPLPKVEQDKLERKAVYEFSKKDITKWEPLVKMNREAPTIVFDEDTNIGFSTVGAIASGFEPRTEFEKKMATLVNDEKVAEAHKEDGARLLEMNKISVEDYLEDRNHIAKMRSLLFRHEMKRKRVKKIKSKTYHRLLKKDRLKAASAESLMDPEAAKEEARKQEFKRAEERMTLKHKNSSKWAKRILKRGLNTQDEGTRAAIAEQLNQHAILTRKMNSMKDSGSGSSSSSGSGDSSDEEDIDRNSADSEEDGASRLLAKAKEKTLKILEEEDEIPNSGVLSLPFMVRGMKKRKEEAIEEAKHALQEYESSLKELEGTGEEENSKAGVTSGRRVFGAIQKEVSEPNNKIKTDNYYRNSDSEDHMEPKENLEVGNRKNNDLQKDVNINSVLLNEDPESHRDSVFKMKSGNKIDTDTMKPTKDTDAKKPTKVVKRVWDNQGLEEMNDESNSDSDDGEREMVDGIISSEPKASYKLPSQEELIRLAFAGDDVEEDFQKDKEKILNEENPVPEKPHLLPGWGQWTSFQQKKGLPSWMVEEHENAKKKREDALKRRKDAHLKHVIISEKLDKKAEKLHTKTLPYPFTSKEVFEQSIRVPVGPEFNPATAIGALNQPEVKKKSGVIIKPIKFEEVNPHEKTEDHKPHGQKQKMNKNKGVSNRRPKSRPVVVK